MDVHHNVKKKKKHQNTAVLVFKDMYMSLVYTTHFNGLKTWSQPWSLPSHVNSFYSIQNIIFLKVQ